MNFSFCDACGNKVMNSIRICPSCGNRSFSAIAPTQATMTASPSPHLSNQAINTIGQQPTTLPPTNANAITPGVHGWLKFLCISLTILTPIFNIALMLGEWRDTKAMFDDMPNLKNAVMLEIISYSAITFFAVFAGTKLWSVKPNAVKITKYYLVAQMLVALIIPGTVLAIISIPGLPSDLYKDVFKIAFHGIFYFAIWYPFLCKSERVKATYI